MKVLKNTENGRNFWKFYVKEKNMSIPASTCVGYFEQFVNDHNIKLKNDEVAIVTDNLESIFNELFDKDGDGRISIHEIRSFFEMIWDNKAVRSKINSLNVDQ